MFVKFWNLMEKVDHYCETKLVKLFKLTDDEKQHFKNSRAFQPETLDGE